MKNTIKLERARRNLTQAQLSEFIQVSRQTINAMEAGKYIPSTVLALKIAKFFEMSVHEIFELEEND